MFSDCNLNMERRRLGYQHVRVLPSPLFNVLGGNGGGRVTVLYEHRGPPSTSYRKSSGCPVCVTPSIFRPAFGKKRLALYKASP